MSALIARARELPGTPLLLGWATWSALAAAELTLLALSIPHQAHGLSGLLPILFALTWMVVGGLLFWRNPDKPIALCAGVFLVAFPLMFTNIAATAGPIIGGALDLLGSTSLLLFLYVFPDGRFVPRWTRWVLLGFALYLLLRAAIPEAALARFSVVDAVVFVSAVLSTIAVQVYRYRHVSSAPEREQTRLVVYGASVALSAFVVLIAADQAGAFGRRAHAEPLIDTVLYAVLLLIPASLAAAILRYRLWDVDLLINRTLVHGTATLILLGVYMGAVLAVTTLIKGVGWIPVSVLTVGLIALLFQPLHRILQGWVNRLMYGERDNPYAVLTQLGRHLQSALAPDATLTGIVETVASTLRLPYVGIELAVSDAASEVVAASGSPAGAQARWPLVYGREELGYVVACPRRGDVFSAADSHLLADLASQAGAAVQAVRLTQGLQRAREQLVIAREEERRRLRRDLHDELGATLGALTVKAGAARLMLDTDPDAVREIIDEIEAELKASVREIRRLVYGLRPPVLDERGLVAAIEESAAQYHATGLSVQLTVEPDRALPPLPAALELAAFRIAQEALTNVARHAGARHCYVRLHYASDDPRRLDVEVSDDGVGLAPGRRIGVGLASMRERAAEVGGSCAIENNPVGGTTIKASLPLRPGGT